MSHPESGLNPATSSIDDTDLALVKRLCTGDETAFLAFYRRYDPTLLTTLTKELRNAVNHRELARELADDLWIDLWSHPRYLLKHNSLLRPLTSFLAFLARQRATRCLVRLRGAKTLANRQLADNYLPDPSIGPDSPSEEWQEFLNTLSSADVVLLNRILSKETKRTQADQKRLERLIQKLRP
jgi:DNA-directed RNA polymerase specialized sigma24 family protein